MPRLTKRVRDGLNGMCGACETILDTEGGAGWGLECVAGPDKFPCEKPSCEVCTSFENMRLACEYVRYIANKKRVKR